MEGETEGEARRGPACLGNQAERGLDLGVNGGPVPSQVPEIQVLDLCNLPYSDKG